MDRTEVVVQNVLEHHGIKGMKWGVRRDGSSGGGSHSSGSGSAKKSKGEVSVHTKAHPQIKTIVRTSGGKGLPAHSDAIASKIVEQKLKKSGMHSVSNAELATYNNRRNLEENAKRLTPEGQVAKGLKVVTGILKTPQGQEAVAKGVTHLSKKRIAKGAAKVAVTTAAMAL